jgi:hypothetical protein
MDGERLRENENDTEDKVTRHPVYIPPTITTYSSEEILEQVGPAQACSPAPCGIF